MTYEESVEYVRQHDDDNADQESVEEAFTTIFGRSPDDQDRQEGLWSHLCAAIENPRELCIHCGQWPHGGVACCHKYWETAND